MATAPDDSPGSDVMAWDGMMTLVCGVLAGDVEGLVMDWVGELLTRTVCDVAVAG